MARKTEHDPTGLRDKRKRSSNRLIARLNLAKREIITIFNAILRSRKIVNRVAYSYDMSPEQLEDLHAKIREIVNESLDTAANRMPSNWWYQPDIEQPTRQGTAEEISNFNRLVTLAIALSLPTSTGLPPQQLTVESVLNSKIYLDALRNVYVENYGLIKSLSTGVADQVIQQINIGIRSGATPTEITSSIADRFSVGASRAKRIAHTDINRAYNDAKMRTVDIAGQQTGLKTGVVHISAFLATSRSRHMARSGNVYTVEEQRRWWDTGSNRINCYCTVSGVLLDENGMRVI